MPLRYLPRHDMMKRPDDITALPRFYFMHILFQILELVTALRKCLLSLAYARSATALRMRRDDERYMVNGHITRVYFSGVAEKVYHGRAAAMQYIEV